MNNQVTIEWIEQQGYLKHWILPELGVNEETAYTNYVTENSLEVILLDASLFNNLDKDTKRYIIYTSRLDHNNLLKFSLSTSAKASLAFCNYWEDCPTLAYIK